MLMDFKPRPLSSLRSVARALTLAASVAALVAVSGCSGASLPSEMAPMTAPNPTETHLLEPGNKVRVTVFGQDNLSGEYLLDPGGMLSLPLIGSLSATGKTSLGLARQIEESLKKGGYLQEPRVAVDMLSLRPFYVLGEVRQPGEFTYSPGMTVLSAIARAGGYDYRAREGDMVLVRLVNGQQREYHAVELTPLLPGDIVKVLERKF